MPPFSPDPRPAQPEPDAILRAIQAERQRLAQLLHDTVSQSLTGTYLLARVLVQKLERDGVASADEFGRLAELLRQAVDEMHEVTRQLAPEEQTANADLKEK